MTVVPSEGSLVGQALGRGGSEEGPLAGLVEHREACVCVVGDGEENTGKMCSSSPGGLEGPGVNGMCGMCV